MRHLVSLLLAVVALIVVPEAHAGIIFSGPWMIPSNQTTYLPVEVMPCCGSTGEVVTDPRAVWVSLGREIDYGFGPITGLQPRQCISIHDLGGGDLSVLSEWEIETWVYEVDGVVYLALVPAQCVMWAEAVVHVHVEQLE